MRARSSSPMERLDLFASKTVAALQRVSRRAVCDARFAAWALEAFHEDEEIAAAALMDEARVSCAEQSLEHVRRSSASSAYVQHWEQVLVDRRQLLARKPVGPQVPTDIKRWVLDRLALVADESEVAVRARKVGTPAQVAFVVADASRDRMAFANRLALLVGAFPIGNSWVELDRAAVESDLAYVIGHDLAYGTERRSAASAAARARRFLDAVGCDAVYFINGSVMSVAGERASYRASTPITLATFDYAVVGVGAERSGIAVFTGED